MTTSTNSCPPECQQDRLTLHKLIEDMSALWKWILGFLMVILIALFGVLYNGQRTNAEKIVELHARITTELSAFKSEITKELNDLTKVVVRMDERQKIRQFKELEDQNRKSEK